MSKLRLLIEIEPASDFQRDFLAGLLAAIANSLELAVPGGHKGNKLTIEAVGLERPRGDT